MDTSWNIYIYIYLTSLTVPHFCACCEPQPGFPTLYVMDFFCIQLFEVQWLFLFLLVTLSTITIYTYCSYTCTYYYGQLPLRESGYISKGHCGRDCISELMVWVQILKLFSILLSERFFFNYQRWKFSPDQQIS